MSCKSKFNPCDDHDIKRGDAGAVKAEKKRNTNEGLVIVPSHTHIPQIRATRGSPRRRQFDRLIDFLHRLTMTHLLYDGSSGGHYPQHRRLKVSRREDETLVYRKQYS